MVDFHNGTSRCLRPLPWMLTLAWLTESALWISDFLISRSSDTLTPVLYISKSINLSRAPINVLVSHALIKALNSSFVIKLIIGDSYFWAGSISTRLLIALYSGAVSATYCINDFIAAIRLFIVTGLFFLFSSRYLQKCCRYSSSKCLIDTFVTDIPWISSRYRKYSRNVSL